MFDRDVLDRRKPRIRRWTTAAVTAAFVLPALWTLVPVRAEAATRCTRTVRGAHTGTLNVAAEEKLCLKGAVQDGAVNVAPKGSLSIIDSKVKGAITLKSGFRQFRFCDSRTVRGALSVTGGKRFVLIGGSGPSCGGNTIDGAVTLDSNEAGVKLARNNIAGAVTASANLEGTTISDNAIGGALTCTANVPAPTNAGESNAVEGGRSGQTCARSTF